MSKKKIMVVDDEPQFLELMQIRLEDSGYEVITLAESDKVLNTARENRPDLVLLDIMMPGVDGYTVYHGLKKDPETRSIPVIIVTAKPEMEELFQVEGVQGYLIKPVDEKDLLTAIDAALNPGGKG